jgi:hypothetical protein
MRREQIVENVPLYPGKRYRLTWYNAEQVIPCVSVEVWSGSRGRTWRTLDGQARRRKEQQAAIAFMRSAATN